MTQFARQMLDCLPRFQAAISKDIGEWLVKGFIDIFLLQEKWQIASDKTGSGNTKNIGSIKNVADLVNGNGVFASAR